MPSSSRTTGITNISGTISTNVNILRGSIDTRKRIIPADLDLIRQTYELFRIHTHDFYDQQYLAFPNTAPQATADRTATTDPVKDAPVDATLIQAGADYYDIFSAQVFELITNFNNYVHTHMHDFDDQAF